MIALVNLDASTATASLNARDSSRARTAEGVENMVAWVCQFNTPHHKIDWLLGRMVSLPLAEQMLLIPQIDLSSAVTLPPSFDCEYRHLVFVSQITIKIACCMVWLCPYNTIFDTEPDSSKCVCM